MGRAAKVQSFFESAMTGFTEQLLNNLQELDIETFINKHSILYNKVEEGSYEQIFK